VAGVAAASFADAEIPEHAVENILGINEPNQLRQRFARRVEMNGSNRRG
jgi:hypothetical protein